MKEDGISLDNCIDTKQRCDHQGWSVGGGDDDCSCQNTPASSPKHTLLPTLTRRRSYVESKKNELYCENSLTLSLKTNSCINFRETEEFNNKVLLDDTHLSRNSSIINLSNQQVILRSQPMEIEKPKGRKRNTLY